MALFSERIAFFGCAHKIIEEKVDRHRDADHITYIVVRQHRHGKCHGEQLIFTVFDQRFDPQQYKREKQHAVDPHRIVLHHNSVRGKSVHYRKYYLVYRLCGMRFMQINAHIHTGKTAFEKQYGV